MTLPRALDILWARASTRMPGSSARMNPSPFLTTRSSPSFNASTGRASRPSRTTGWASDSTDLGGGAPPPVSDDRMAVDLDDLGGGDPAAFGVAVAGVLGLAQDHPLVDEPPERLG